MPTCMLELDEPSVDVNSQRRPYVDRNSQRSASVDVHSQGRPSVDQVSSLVRSVEGLAAEVDEIKSVLGTVTKMDANIQQVNAKLDSERDLQRGLTSVLDSLTSMSTVLAKTDASMQHMNWKLESRHATLDVDVVEAKIFSKLKSLLEETVQDNLKVQMEQGMRSTQVLVEEVLRENLKLQIEQAMQPIMQQVINKIDNIDVTPPKVDLGAIADLGLRLGMVQETLTLINDKPDVDLQPVLEKVAQVNRKIPEDLSPILDEIAQLDQRVVDAIAQVKAEPSIVSEVDIDPVLEAIDKLRASQEHVLGRVDQLDTAISNSISGLQEKSLISVGMTLNVDYQKLSADDKVELQGKIRDVLAESASVDQAAVSVTLTPGSVKVDAEIQTPDANSAQSIEKAMNENNIAENVLQAANSIPGVKAAAMGELKVTGLEVKTEVLQSVLSSIKSFHAIYCDKFEEEFRPMRVCLEAALGGFGLLSKQLAALELKSPTLDLDKIRQVLEAHVPTREAQPEVPTRLTTAVEDQSGVLNQMLARIVRLDEKMQSDVENIFHAVSNIQAAPPVKLDTQPLEDAIAQVQQTMTSQSKRNVELAPIVDAISRPTRDIVDKIEALDLRLSQAFLEMRPIEQAVKNIDMRPLEQAVKSIDVKPHVDMRQVIEAIGKIDVKPVVNFQPILDAISQIDTLAVAPVVAPDIKDISIQCKELLKEIQQININPQVDMTPVLQEIEKIDVQPILDLQPVLDAISDVDAQSKIVVKMAMQMNSKPPIDFQPILDKIGRINVKAQIQGALKPVLDAVQLVDGKLERIGMKEQLKAAAKAQKGEKPQVQALTSADMKQVLDAISKVSDAVTETHSETALKTVLDEITNSRIQSHRDFCAVCDKVRQVNVESQIRSGLAPVIDSISQIEVRPQVNMRPCLHAMEKVVNNIKEINENTQEKMESLLEGLTKIQGVDLTPILRRIDELNLDLQKIHANFKPVFHEISKIDVQPQVDLGKIIEAISKIDVRPQVDMQPVMRPVVDAIMQIDVRPEVDLHRVIDGIEHINVRPQIQAALKPVLDLLSTHIETRQKVDLTPVLDAVAEIPQVTLTFNTAGMSSGSAGNAPRRSFAGRRSGSVHFASRSSTASFDPAETLLVQNTQTNAQAPGCDRHSIGSYVASVDVSPAGCSKMEDTLPVTTYSSTILAGGGPGFSQGEEVDSEDVTPVLAGPAGAALKSDRRTSSA